MSYILKDPAAVLDYCVDWGAQYLTPGELLAASDWTVVPNDPAGLSIAGSDFSATTSSVKAAAGSAGKIYRLVNRICTDAGRTDERSILIRVEDR